MCIAAEVNLTFEIVLMLENEAIIDIVLSFPPVYSTYKLTAPNC